jgi:hypothetical protein
MRLSTKYVHSYMDNDATDFSAVKMLLNNDQYTIGLFLTANLVTKYIFLLKSSITLGLNTYQASIQDSSTK